MSSLSDPGSVTDSKEVDVELKSISEEFDPIAYYERNAGRLVIDPA